MRVELRVAARPGHCGLAMTKPSAARGRGSIMATAARVLAGVAESE